jgi:hypothetical protein
MSLTIPADVLKKIREEKMAKAKRDIGKEIFSGEAQCDRLLRRAVDGESRRVCIDAADSLLKQLQHWLTAHRSDLV